MTSQKALHCIYCYWLIRDNSAMSQLKPFRISIQYTALNFIRTTHGSVLAQSIELHSHHTSSFTFQVEKINVKFTTNSYKKNWNNFILCYHLLPNQNFPMVTKNLLKNFGSELNHKPVKYFYSVYIEPITSLGF